MRTVAGAPPAAYDLHGRRALASPALAAVPSVSAASWVHGAVASPADMLGIDEAEHFYLAVPEGGAPRLATHASSSMSINSTKNNPIDEPRHSGCAHRRF